MSKIQTIHTPGKLQNLVINGALDFWQEKVGNTTTINTATGGIIYYADMFRAGHSGPSTKNFSLVRSSDVPTQDQSGVLASYSSLYTQVTGIPSLNAADALEPVWYGMEGKDYFQIHNKSMTLGFWVKPSVSGIYSIALRNDGSQATRRSYVTTFSAVGGVWQYVEKTIKMDNTSFWSFDSNLGVGVFIGNVTGTNSRTAVKDQWQNGVFGTSTDSTNWMATNGATLRVTLVSIVQGNFGFGPKGFQRAGDTIQAELSMCQRYYEKSYDLEVLPGSASSLGWEAFVGSTHPSSFYRHGPTYKSNKRSAATITIWDTNGVIGQVCRDSGAGASWGSTISGQKGFTSQGTITNNIEYTYQWVADARM